MLYCVSVLRSKFKPLNRILRNATFPQNLSFVPIFVNAVDVLNSEHINLVLIRYKIERKTIMCIV